jgi:hypothetical protein
MFPDLLADISEPNHLAFPFAFPAEINTKSINSLAVYFVNGDKNF